MTEQQTRNDETGHPRKEENGSGNEPETRHIGRTELFSGEDQIVITPHEFLTAQEVPDLQAALKQELERGIQQVVFDMSQTTMVDSSGIGLLIATSNHLSQQKGTVQIINVSPDIMKLFQSMRLVKRLNVIAREGEEETHG